MLTAGEVQDTEQACHEPVIYMPTRKRRVVETGYGKAKQKFETTATHGDEGQAGPSTEEMEELVADISHTDNVLQTQNKENLANRPTPFQVLGLPTYTPNEAIVERGQELCDHTESAEQRLLYRWAMEELLVRPVVRSAHELQEHARRLELQVATTRLLALLFPEGDWASTTPGRYQFLQEVVGHHSELLQGLLHSKSTSVWSESVLRRWSQALKARQADVSVSPWTRRHVLGASTKEFRRGEFSWR